MRKLAALLMLACAAAQPAPASALHARALTLGLHARHHAHAVSVVSEDGHFHLVLSHAAQRDSGDHRGPARPDDPQASFSESDHVLHLAGDDPVNATARRGDASQPPLLAIAVALPSVPAPLSVFRPSPEPRARGADQLRTVVLRL